MFTLRRLFFTALALAALLAGALTAAGPARAVPAATAAHAAPAGTAFYDQHNSDGYYWNNWNGFGTLATYGGVTFNDDIEIQWIGNGQFQLADLAYDGCIGDSGNSQYSALAVGGLSCPSSGIAGWGTRFIQVSAGCPAGYFLYKNVHWNAYADLENGNDNDVYLNTAGVCITQSD